MFNRFGKHRKGMDTPSSKMSVENLHKLQTPMQPSSKSESDLHNVKLNSRQQEEMNKQKLRAQIEQEK